MAAPQGTIYFSGIRSLMSGQFTLSHGISPSTCTLSIPPQPGRLILSGELLLEYGRTRFRFPDCRVDRIIATQDATGSEVWQLIILDRRWLWRETGRISGFYNVRRDENTIVDDTEKSPQDLAKLCLDAMGEKNYDVRALPNDARPEIEWDYANPAEALARLCDTLGCRVVMNMDQRVQLHRIGKGRTLPQGQIEGQLTLDPPDPPGEIIIVGARARWQGDLELEPVGLDVDGEIKPIRELSYAPRHGGRRSWEFSDIDHFNDLRVKKHRALAQQSVYRWFRVKTPLELPGLKDEIEDLDRILPLEDVQVETMEVQGRRESRPPWVYGKFWMGHEDHKAREERDLPNIKNRPKSQYTQGFSVDADLGIVKFNKPVFTFEEIFVNQGGRRVSGGLKILDPTLFLRIAVNLRDKETRGWIRGQWRKKPKRRTRRTQTSARKKYVLHEDIIREHYIDFTRGKRLVRNDDEVQAMAGYYLDAELAQYDFDDSGSMTYPGLIPVDLDGAFQQVTWIVTGEGFALTRVSRNREEFIITPDYNERRLFERLAEARKQQEATARAEKQRIRKNRA